MENLSQEELKTLYLNFVHYRDTVCNGHAAIGVHEFYKKFGLNQYHV